MTYRRAVLLASLLLASGCAGADPGTPAAPAAQTEREDEVQPTRASRELAVARERGATAVAPAAPAAPPTPAPLFEVRYVDADEGEDGRGAVVSATRPVAFDLDARRFPARALDPVLHVGELSLRRYTHPRVGVLRFVAADAAALPVGAPVAVEYDGDPDSRVLVADALELP